MRYHYKLCCGQLKSKREFTFPNGVLERVKLYRISNAVLNSAVVNSREVKYRYSKLLLKSQISNR